MARGVWWALAHRVTKSQLQLKQLGLHAHTLVEVWCLEEGR